jgi:hypothetical protein
LNFLTIFNDCSLLKDDIVALLESNLAFAVNCC